MINYSPLELQTNIDYWVFQLRLYTLCSYRVTAEEAFKVIAPLRVLESFIGLNKGKSNSSENNFSWRNKWTSMQCYCFS